MSRATATRTRRIVVVTRPTELELLLARHGTRGQVEFFLASRGRGLEEVEERQDAHDVALRRVLGAIPVEWRRARVDRSDLDRFLFEPDDIVVVVGQDGLVPNVAKYLDGQPVIGIDPEPGRNPGVLVLHRADEAGRLLEVVDRGSAAVERRCMVEARLDDGRRLVALNEIFIGHRSHQSARYTLTCPTGRERQSSSGVIVASGTGATGWAASIHRERGSSVRLPEPTERRLAFFAREAWPSPATGTRITEGLLEAGDRLTIASEMDGGVVFGDGIESDPIPLDWGRRVELEVAEVTSDLVL